MTHPAVAECAVVGAKDSLKGEVPVAFVVIKAGTTLTDSEISVQISHKIRETIGPVASFKRTHVVRMLPKTRSGKLLRRSLRHIVDHQSLKGHVAPPTIEDYSVLEEVNSIVNQGVSNS